ncbi:hypothetical protein ACHAXS_005772 [Conticribra weissflogii]
MTMSPIKFVSAAIILLWSASAPPAAAMTEEHRLEEYHKRGYKWPLEKVVPDTPGWDRIMRRRFEQVARIEDSNARYNGWMAFITSALLATNYTENGWGLTRAPEHITKRLQQRLHKTLVEMEIEEEQPDGTVTTKKKIPQGQGTRKEHYINVIGGDEDSRPIMIQDYRENDEILMEMKPMFEWWSGVDLEGSIAYGIRAYRNDSNLLMHVDKSSTHIISGIFHIDHSEDSEPWPIIIEDFQGNTNQVYMEAGDILFYESSKCFHGRPQTFIGSYYASLFMHYRPVGYPADKMEKEIHYAVPPHWSQQLPPVEGLDELEVVGTSFKEPNCKNLLCSVDESNENSKYLVNWHGPAPKGKIVTNGWDPETMTPPEDMDEEFSGGNREMSAARKVLENEARAGSDEL